jgi:hypothetical protein
MRATSVILPSALRIAEEPEKKASQQKGHDCPDPTPRYQPYQNGSRDETQTIKISVTHHVCDQTLAEL